MPEERQYVENHPFFHDWSSTQDQIVRTKRNGAPIEVKRIEKCANCPTLRVSVLEIVWRNGEPVELNVLRRWYRYEPNTVIIRDSKSEWYLDLFLKSTDLEFFK